MKAQRLILSVTLILLAALMVTAPASARGGVIQYRGVISAHDEAPADLIDVLPGGRLLLRIPRTDIAYEVETKGGPDYVSGQYFSTSDCILQPGGSILFWGNWQSTDLNYWGGTDEGWWSGTVTGVSQMRDDARGNMHFTAHGTGHGALEGWTIMWNVRWKDGVTTGPTTSVSGHMTPPKGWSE